MILFMILASSIALILVVAFSNWFRGASGTESAVLLGMSITVFLFGPLAIYLGLTDILNVDIVPMLVRQYILTPMFLTISIGTLVMAVILDSNQQY